MSQSSCMVHQSRIKTAHAFPVTGWTPKPVALSAPSIDEGGRVVASLSHTDIVSCGRLPGNGQGCLPLTGRQYPKKPDACHRHLYRDGLYTTPEANAGTNTGLS